MAMRYLQIFIPEIPGEELKALVAEHAIIGTYRDASESDRVVVHLVLEAEESEPIMDEFAKRFEDDDKFRLILFAIEAVLPRSESEDIDQIQEDKDEVGDAVAESGRVSREELYNMVANGLGINRVFVAMALLSSIVACVGLLRDDVAVIIGAMVIAPLLAPNMALALAITLRDAGLLRRAFKNLIVGIILSLIVPIGVGWLYTVDSSIHAISTRTSVNMGDMFLALSAGAAGTFAYTRGLSGAVIGVMVAVALLPPLAVSGMLVGSFQLTLASQAFLLTGMNIFCIIMAGIATFIAQGVRPGKTDE